MNKTTFIFAAAVGLVVIALAFGVKDLGPGGPGGPAVGGTTTPGQAPVERPGGADEPTTSPEPGITAQGRCATDAGARAEAPLKLGRITAGLSHSKVLTGGGDDIFVSFDIETEDIVLEDRPPLNLALVIDRSGSMRGGPMEQARGAARGLVTRLGPADRVAIVTYDTGAEVVVPSIHVDRAGRARLLSAIDGITARGMTNIHDGLVLGYEELTRGLSKGAISRMVHLSDGQANVGVTDTPSLVRLSAEAAARGIRSTSVGLGVHYNEQLMEALAEAGRGRYYYVRVGGALDEIFAGELRNIQATVAGNVELRLEPCPGVRVEQIYVPSTRREGDAMVASLADLAGGEQRRVVARLSAEPGSLGKLPMVYATLDYEDVDDREMHRATLALSAEAVGDPRVADASVDRDVMAQAIEVQGALALRRATESFNRGDRTAAARHLQDKQVELQRKTERYQMQRAPAARRTRSVLDNFRGVFGASADALAGEAARDVALEAQVEARSMEVIRSQPGGSGGDW